MKTPGIEVKLIFNLDEIKLNPQMQRGKVLSDFSRWSINMEHFSLKNQREGEEIFVEPRLIKVLNLLVTNAGKVVKRQELLDIVWDDVVVTEESLSKAIFDLRKFLGEHFRNAPEIVTIRKVGYKMILQELPTQKYRVLRLTGKVAAYLVGIFLFLVMLIRAIRYDN